VVVRTSAEITIMVEIQTAQLEFLLNPPFRMIGITGRKKKANACEPIPILRAVRSERRDRWGKRGWVRG